MKISNEETIIKLLKQIARYDVCNSDTGFSSDKEAIRKLFSLTNSGKEEDYLLRLTVIDSMYSTQMNRRYYGLEELAGALYEINATDNMSIEELFLQYLKTKNESLFNYTDKLTKEKKNLLSEKYGIGKDGKDKGCAISLISKYAYFATNYQFPIFDSIACEMYPRVWRYCGFEGKPSKLIVREDKSMEMDGVATMKAYVSAIDDLINKLGGNISYDHLDRLLWFVGKIMRGNLSLVLNRQDYKWCTSNLKNCYTAKGEFNFEIKEIDLKDLKFLKKDSLLYSFFLLAKEISATSM